MTDNLFSDNQKLTPIGQLGEQGLIQRLVQNIRFSQESSLLGAGDDAAIIAPTAGEQLLLSTDTLAEGVHFDLMYTPLKHLGYKAVVVAISDIIAMNARPKQLTLALAISAKYTVEAIEELYRGVLAACEAYRVDLVGGDVTASPSGLIMNMSVLGSAMPEHIVKRSGAREGDLICVSGDLGGAFVGLNLLEREKRIFRDNPEIQPDFGDNDYLLQRQLRPEARLDLLDTLAGMGLKPTAMIDLSDGLGRDLQQLCEASQTGCKLYEAKLPIDPKTMSMALEFNIDPTLCVLSGGEDYEMLFSLPASDFDKLKQHPDISVVGHMTDASEGLYLISKSGQAHELKERMLVTG
ncbi:MAG: thiamine-phosphate kinase [Bacteroidia bacterium]